MSPKPEANSNSSSPGWGSRRCVPIALLLFITVWAPSVAAQDSSKTNICSTPWSEADQAILELGHPKELILLQLSLMTPVALSPSGADHELRVFAQTTLHGSYYPEKVSIVTPYAVIALSGIGYGTAALWGDCQAQRTTSSIIFALTETLLWVGLEKWVTGRPFPTNDRDPYADDRLDHPEDAEIFEPFSRGLAAFPSGHTATIFAAAAALRASSPSWGAWRYMGYPFAVAVGFAMWWGDHHWASDVISGAMIGEALGGAAGRAWSKSARVESWSLSFLPTQGGAFISASGRY